MYYTLLYLVEKTTTTRHNKRASVLLMQGRFWSEKMLAHVARINSIHLAIFFPLFRAKVQNGINVAAVQKTEK